MRKLIIGGMVALLLGISLPASAHNEPGWRHGKHFHGKHGHHHRHGARPAHRFHRPREVHNYYYSQALPPAPPPAGVSVIFPEIFIPWQ
jgi:hypothetical protein